MFGLSFSKSYPLNKIYLSKDRLIGNYQFLAGLCKGVQVAPVLKSNAYGHGIKEIGKIIDTQNPPFICVDSLYEAIQLKKIGVKSEILIMGYIDPRSLKGKKLPFSYAVFDLDQLAAINMYQPQAKIHLFFDTGMHREGFDIRNIKNLIRQFKSFKQMNIVGVMSHLSIPDKPSDPLTKLQINNFRAAKQLVLDLGFHPTWFHLGGSYALLNGLVQDCNVVRCGISLYGFPSKTVYPGSLLQPVLKLVTKIAQWKYIKKGDLIGYDKAYQARQEMIIGVLPIGYNDGVDRRLSNQGELFCKPVGLDDFEDKRSHVYDKLPHKVGCKIVGLISMNIMTIDLTQAKNILGSKMPAIGDEIEVFSSDPLFPNCIEQAAKLCSSNPYELLVHLHPSTKREII